MSKKGLEKNMRRNGGINGCMAPYKTRSGEDTIDMKRTNNWLNLHAEGYLTAIQEQKLDVKETRKNKKRPAEKDGNWYTLRTMSPEKRICVPLSMLMPSFGTHILLNVRHNHIARILYQEILKSDELTMKPPPVTKKEDMEIWRDEPVQTIGKVEKNKPDMILSYTDKKLCQIVEITVPLDNNVRTAYKEKELEYIPLISNMQRVYSEYRFQTVIITLGAMEAIPENLKENLEKLHFTSNRIKVIIEWLQKAALIGTIKICKTAMRMWSINWHQWRRTFE